MTITGIELCAGAGGQALGLERAGIESRAFVEIDTHCCNTLQYNRPHWNVVNDNIKNFSGASYKGIDLVSGGLPCPPFSKAGKQLGKNDERDLFPEAIRLIDEIKPRAVMIENVRGFLDAAFDDYRLQLQHTLKKLGYTANWKLLNASDYGVSQLRPRVVIIALRKEIVEHFAWPQTFAKEPLTVGELLYKQMGTNNWTGVDAWKQQANTIAPTIVGGSKKHGGPDLGPTRAKQAWAKLGVDGMGIANFPPEKEFEGMPRLTVSMVAKIQGFPDDWHFTGKKTPAYRQVGNAFPPPVAQAVGVQLVKCLQTQKYFNVGKTVQWPKDKAPAQSYDSIS